MQSVICRFLLNNVLLFSSSNRLNCQLLKFLYFVLFLTFHDNYEEHSVGQLTLRKHTGFHRNFWSYSCCSTYGFLGLVLRTIWQGFFNEHGLLTLSLTLSLFIKIYHLIETIIRVSESTFGYHITIIWYWLDLWKKLSWINK